MTTKRKTMSFISLCTYTHTPHHHLPTTHSRPPSSIFSCPPPHYIHPHTKVWHVAVWPRRLVQRPPCQPMVRRCDQSDGTGGDGDTLVSRTVLHDWPARGWVRVQHTGSGAAEHVVSKPAGDDAGDLCRLRVLMVRVVSTSIGCSRKQCMVCMTLRA